MVDTRTPKTSTTVEESGLIQPSLQGNEHNPRQQEQSDASLDITNDWINSEQAPTVPISLPTKESLSDRELGTAEELQLKTDVAAEELLLAPEKILLDESHSFTVGLKHPEQDAMERSQTIQPTKSNSSSNTSSSTTTTTPSPVGSHRRNSLEIDTKNVHVVGGWTLFYRQVVAMLSQIWLTKYRTPIGTCMEFLTPVLMMLVLVAAYGLSEITYEEAQTFDSIQLDVPGPWVNLAAEFIQQQQNGSSFWTLVGNNSDNTERRLGNVFQQMPHQPWDDIGFGIGERKLHQAPPRERFWEEQENGVKLQAWNHPLQRVLNSVREGFRYINNDNNNNNNKNMGQRHALRFLQGMEPEEDDDEEDETIGGEGDIYDWLNDAYRQLRRLLKNPLIVPRFSEYIELSNALSGWLDVDDLPLLFTDSSYGRQWGNLLTLGTLHLSPRKAPAVQALQEYLNATYPRIMKQREGGIRIRVHDTEAEALKYIDDTNSYERTWALIDLDRFELKQSSEQQQRRQQQAAKPEVRYTIRMNYTTLPNTNEIIDFVSIGLNTQYQRYYLSGYLTLQRTLNEFAMDYYASYAGNNSADNNTMCRPPEQETWSMPMPTASYEQNSFYLAVGYLLGLTIAMAYLYPTSRFIKCLVEEKELRIKETLFIMGLRPSAHWWAWLLTGFTTFGIIAMLVTRTLAANVLLYSSPAYLFAWIFFFSTSTMGFSFAVAALFSKAKLSAIVGPIALFATLLPRFIFFGYNRYEASAAKKWCSLFPATAFSFGADIVSDYEYSQQGVQSWNAGEGDYSFNTSVGFLFLDTLLYTFLGWYLDQVLPREYGSPKPFWFLFSPTYWCGGCVRTLGLSRNSGETVTLKHGEGTSSNDGDDHERVSDRNLVPRVVVRNLYMVYPKNKRKDIPPAVDHLDLNLYESQITTLLGHNGAGKTTTISLLTGLFRPTSGDASIYGNSITHDVGAARRSIGICPQQNVLFEKLTVKEHIFFFQRLKGIRPSLEGAREMTQEIGLEEFLHVTSSALSGGNKRKLCVAAALCGEPQFLVLDEPTSGMDPGARRKTWDVLRKRRQGRTILLCTHFMDEAEILSDRVAIMKAGKLRCSGSPFFLKQRFGVGYNFTAVIELQSVPRQELEEQNAEGYSEQVSLEIAAERLLKFTQVHVPGAKIHRVGGKEVTICLPSGSEGAFPQLFDELQLLRSSLAVGAFGVENASLEEVLIGLAEDNESEDGVDENDSNVTAADSVNSITVVDRPGFLTQVGLLYWKRISVQRRDPKGFFFTVIVPVLLVALVLLILTINVPIVGPAIELSPNLYRFSNIGNPAETDVLVGGGISPGGGESTYTNLRDWSLQNYGHLHFDRRPGIESSQALSQFLSESINTHNHNERYGAFSLKDSVDMNITVDWGGIFSGIVKVVNDLKDTNSSDPIDVLAFLGGGVDEVASFAVNASVESVVSFLGLSNFTFTPLFPETLLDSSLESIFSGANFSRMQFENEIEHIVNHTFIDYDLEFRFNKTVTELIKVISNRWNNTLISETLSLLIMETAREWNTTQFVAETTSFVYGNKSISDIWKSGDIFEKIFFRMNETIVEALNMTGILDEFAFVLNETLVSELESDLRKTSFLFNKTLVAGEMVNVLSSFMATNLGFQPSQLTKFLIEEANWTLTSASYPILVMSVWAMTRADSQLKEHGGWERSLSFSDLGAILGTNVTEEHLFRVNVSVASFYPSEGILFVSGIFVSSDSNVFVEDGWFNITLLPDSEFNDSFPPEKDIYHVHFDAESSILHNASSPHSVAAFNQHYMEFLFKKCTGITEARLISENHPLPLTTQQSLEIKTILSVFASMFILIPYCFIPGAFIVFLVIEKSCKSKHLQLVSGTDLTAYWVSSYLYDTSRFLVLTFLIMMVFLMYGKDAAQVFVGTSEAFWCTALLTLGYGLSILPFSYLLARRFDNHSSAQIAVIGLVFITGFVAVNAYYIMISIDKTKDIAELLQPLFRLWPAYSVGEGLLAMSSAFWEKEVLGQDKSPLDWDVAGKPLALLYGLALPYFLILLFVEFAQDGGAGGMCGRMLRCISEAFEKWAMRCCGVKTENGVLILDDGLRDDEKGCDSDVLHEEAFVREHSIELLKSAPIMFQDLWKIYLPSVGLFGSCVGSCKRIVRDLCCRCQKSGASDTEVRRALQPKRAVRGLTAAVRQGEIFGLLGSNGAGKSTTLAMLTGDIAPTSGKIFVAGFDATGKEDVNGVTNARQNIGFCPQVDPLIDLMSVRETLIMFGRLRGIGKADINVVVDRMLRQLMLVPHAGKTCDSLSGGNKRKLSLGIALIGGPSVLLIDESSSGLDPLAKRRMWNLISSVSMDKTVMITTHSMEEAEALCTRACIMAKGQLLCLGSVQHLKTRYLDGYTIDIFCSSLSSDANVEEVISEVLESTLPGSKLSEHHGRFLRFDFSNVSGVGLGSTFRNLECLKHKGGSVVESYSISQCSLEQVFVQLADHISSSESKTGSIASLDMSDEENITNEEASVH